MQWYVHMNLNAILVANHTLNKSRLLEHGQFPKQRIYVPGEVQGNAIILREIPMHL